MSLARRTLLGAATGAAAASLGRQALGAPQSRAFPKDFLWGAATAAHQVEGNNTGSDMWLLENVKPTMFAEPSGDAANSFEMWPQDLDLVRGLGLNTYRFSIEWARIEPEPGQFSMAMLDHYKAMVEGCHKRGLAPMVTFNHFSLPRWFAARGGWQQADAAAIFGRFCDRAARHLADGLAYATTLNEPNLAALVVPTLPPPVLQVLRAMNAAAAKACGSSAFRNAALPEPSDIPTVNANLISAHKEGKAAIKAVRGSLPVGMSLAIPDDEPVGQNSLRDAKREALYGEWLRAARADDFVGVQNYTRTLWNDRGPLPPPAGAQLNTAGEEIYPPSLANAVRYAHQVSGVPVIVTEHGLGADDDALRAKFIPAALVELQKVIAEGIPVRGYIHWSLLDNFEWFFGYKRRFGLVSVDRKTFQRTPKPSARVLAAIARANRVEGRSGGK